MKNRKKPKQALGLVVAITGDVQRQLEAFGAPGTTHIPTTNRLIPRIVPTALRYCKLGSPILTEIAKRDRILAGNLLIDQVQRELKGQTWVEIATGVAIRFNL